MRLKFIQKFNPELTQWSNGVTYRVVDLDMPTPLPTLGWVQKLDTPRKVNGQTYRWRAHINGKWLDIQRRKDFADVYEDITQGRYTVEDLNRVRAILERHSRGQKGDA